MKSPDFYSILVYVGLKDLYIWIRKDIMKSPAWLAIFAIVEKNHVLIK
jgi:hypothetical protein